MWIKFFLTNKNQVKKIITGYALSCKYVVIMNPPKSSTVTAVIGPFSTAVSGIDFFSHHFSTQLENNVSALR